MENKGIIIIPLVAVVILGLPFAIQQIRGESPTAVAQKIMQAAQEDDTEAARPYVTEKAWGNYSNGISGFFIRYRVGDEQSDGLQFEILDETIDGTEADVPVRITVYGETDTIILKLRKEDAKWLLYAVGITAEDVTMTLDFEKM